MLCSTWMMNRRRGACQCANPDLAWILRQVVTTKMRPNYKGLPVYRTNLMERRALMKFPRKMLKKTYHMNPGAQVTVAGAALAVLAHQNAIVIHLLDD